MFRLFNKNNSNNAVENLNELSSVDHWYSNRYHSVTLQRNILLFIVVLLCLSVGISSFSIFKISKSKTIEPFVVEIERKSGIVTLVNPLTVKQYSADEAVNNHFITEYIMARELFDANNFEYNFYTKVRLFSAQNVYYEFRNWIKPSNANSPFNLYANTVSGDMKIRSLQTLKSNQVQVRFTLKFNQPNGEVIVKDRIATLSFEYNILKINEQQRYINPLGFQITYYKVDDEYL